MLKTICKKITALLLVVTCIITFASSCSNQNATGTSKENTVSTDTTSNSEKAVPTDATDNSKDAVVSTDHPQVQFEMETGDKMVFQLYPEFAPEAVNNFVSLAKAGFYDGLTFHRIIKDFMIQSGDPKGNGTGGSEKTIKGEFSENSFSKNALSHVRGVLSMARGGNPDSASSQFFIMHADQRGLDGKYAAFGMLISGEEALDKIASTPVTVSDSNPEETSKPTKTVKIKSVTVLKK